MGGGGFMADMIARINYNKEMLSKHPYLNKTRKTHYPTIQKKSHKKNLSEREKQALAEKMKELKTKNRKRNTLIFIFSILLTAICILILCNFLRTLFS